MTVGHPEDPSNALVDLENALGGLPLRRTTTCIFGRHTVTYDVDVVAVGSDPPPASVLSVPAGFRRVSESGSGR